MKKRTFLKTCFLGLGSTLTGLFVKNEIPYGIIYAPYEVQYKNFDLNGTWMPSSGYLRKLINKDYYTTITTITISS